MATLTSSGLKTGCPICLASDIRKRWEINKFIIAQCQTCRFVFVQDEITDSELAAYYELESEPVYTEDSNAENLNYYFESLKRIIEKQVKCGDILDVGCSSGQFLDTMTGWTCSGIELSSAAEIAEQKYGANISRAPLAKGQWRPQSFDVITLLDSFDHMQRPLEVLEICHEILKPGGIIVVKVHDVSSLFARLFSHRYYALIPPSHLSYFSPQTLDYALKKTGFTPREVIYIPHILFLKTVFFRFSRQNTESLSWMIYANLKENPLGNIKLKKNMFDIMTVVATS